MTLAMVQRMVLLAYKGMSWGRGGCEFQTGRAERSHVELLSAIEDVSVSQSIVPGGEWTMEGIGEEEQ